MLQIDPNLRPSDLLPAIQQMWDASATAIRSIHDTWNPDDGSPVFTVEGRYTAQGWTEWTQGFQFGSALLQFDGTGDSQFLDMGRDGTREKMAPHVTHVGVHDHGFNNVSTYGALRRLMLEERIPHDASALDFYELALKASGAVQASRWTTTHDGGGFIYSFNGPHSLFSDTVRSLRSLSLAHSLGHRLMGENDASISLLDRLLKHAEATAVYNVYYGEGRDVYDVCGRVVHESVFNTNDGQYRCPSTQQGYSPFSTWTRGLAWVMLGYPEQLEWLQTFESADHAEIEALMLRAAMAACDFYIENTPTDGVPYWDTGAPRLVLLGEYLDRPSDPFNGEEPVDSSAAAIACQGLLRLGRYLSSMGELDSGQTYTQAGLTVLRSLLDEPYLSTDADHQGLLLHSVYHRPRGWDVVPEDQSIPSQESCLWGDYHLLEGALYTQRLANDEPYYTFFGPTQTRL